MSVAFPKIRTSDRECLVLSSRLFQNKLRLPSSNALNCCISNLEIVAKLPWVKFHYRCTYFVLFYFSLHWVKNIVIAFSILILHFLLWCKAFSILMLLSTLMSNFLVFYSSWLLKANNPFPSKWVLRALIDFTLSNARRCYSSMGNPLDRKGLKKLVSTDYMFRKESLLK